MLKENNLFIKTFGNILSDDANKFNRGIESDGTKELIHRKELEEFKKRN